MHSALFRSTLVIVFKFLQIKEGRIIFGGWGEEDGENNFAASLNYLVPPSVSQC